MAEGEFSLTVSSLCTNSRVAKNVMRKLMLKMSEKKRSNCTIPQHKNVNAKRLKSIYMLTYKKLYVAVLVPHSGALIFIYLNVL